MSQISPVAEDSAALAAEEIDVKPAEAAAADSAADGTSAAASAADDHDKHPSDWQYVKIAIILGVLTAVEVFTYFESVHRLGDAALFALLTVLMVLKFVYVAAWFMHLKFDSVLFKRIFMTGIALALGVYLIMLTAFSFWT